MIIAGESVAGTGAEVRGFDPATGTPLEPAYRYGDGSHVDAACAAAGEAFHVYRAVDPRRRAEFLEAIAAGLETLGPELVDRAVAETGLPQARIAGEVGRTAAQLRLFAAVLAEGSWQGVWIDPGQPDRTPAPRPDIRQRAVPLGPVAVFGAGNFPLAFSVAGGDTASALAAGCPVVAKAHDAHPGTSELVGRVVADAVRATGMPAGTFSLLYGDGPELGGALVADPRIKAVGFTGSRSGGTALAAIAAARPQPIPVYAEMSAINPVFLLPGALGSQAAAIASGFVGSLTMGSGQFCTNPGLVIGVDGPELDEFLTAAGEDLQSRPAQPMLTPGIAANYERGVAELSLHAALVAQGQEGPRQHGQAALFSTDAATFLASLELQAEVFGAAAVVVRCRDEDEMIALARYLEGQLTVSVHSDESDLAIAARLLPELELIAGRIVFNDWPTGVEVGHAMIHGGPCPATTDARSTSVGARAIERFLRPVCYQSLPDSLQPKVIADGNPDGIWRRIDGRLSRD
ncbi:aldehyde dehydrogenase (NADP(+)) [Mycobacterium sp. OTB74]|uniref:aldehyde dehydrogenase (NADP(+)) n=1 Tax=Mycobacterium sp. OTB74 TaxID=1853452 RepID=UPI00247541C2|nr:aldehyde dehydrogenase (NADP(+)) [Mycobacterium sp. OTB74]